MKKLLILVVPLLLLGLLGGAVWWKYGRARDPFAQAQQMMDRGDLPGAQIELRNTLRANPNNVTAHYRLGQVNLRQGDVVAAEKELRTARDMGFEARVINPLLAQTYYQQGHYTDLLRDFSTQGLPVDQAGPLLVLRAMSQLSLNDLKSAQATAVEAERAQPNSSDAVMVSARIAVAQHDFTTAQQKVDRALQVNPRSTDALLLKGQLQNVQGDRVRALESFDAALALNPNMVAARLERANVLMLSDQDKRAKEDVNAAIKLQPTSAMAVFLQGVLATKDQDYETADAAFTKIGDLLQRFPRGFYFQAIEKFNLGAGEQASAAATNYLAHNPTDPDAIKLYAKIELSAQRTATAIRMLGKAISDGSNDPDMLDLLGTAYAMAGQPQQALQSLERAAALAPTNASILTRLASVRMSLGDSVRATTDLEHALDITPTEAGAGEQLVLAAVSAGEIDKATVALERLHTQQGDSETVGNLTALIKMAQLDLDGARTMLTDVVKRYPDAIQPRINLAKVLTLQDKAPDAEKVLTDVLSRQPANAAALASMVGMLLADGQPAKAVTLLETAYAAAPKNVDVIAGLANLYARTGAGKKALTLLVKAQKDLPNNPALLAVQARTEQSLGQTADARHTYQTLLEQMPTDVETRRVLAGMMAAANDLQGAQKLLLDGLKQQPGNTTLLQSYVGIILKAKGIDAALAGADDLVRDPANLPGARLLRGDIYMAAGRYTDAAIAYTAELQGAPSIVTLLRLVNALAADGRGEQATQALRDWLGGHPTDAGAASALAGLDIAARRFFDAEQHLQIVLNQQPSNADALNNLAWVLQQRADPRARPVAQKSYLLAPSPQAADTLGWILTTQGQAGNALTLLRQASALLPGEPTVQYHLAVALKDTGHRDEAIQILRPAAEGLINFDDKPAAQRLMQELSSSK